MSARARVVLGEHSGGKAYLEVRVTTQQRTETVVMLPPTRSRASVTRMLFVRSACFVLRACGSVRELAVTQLPNPA